MGISGGAVGRGKSDNAVVRPGRPGGGVHAHAVRVEVGGAPALDGCGDLALY